MWLVALPVLIVEDRSVGRSLIRSSRLTKGHRLAIVPIALLAASLYPVPFATTILRPPSWLPSP